MNPIVERGFDALAGARHADPFSLLGPHRENGSLVVRTFHPAAERVFVAGSHEPVEMSRRSNPVPIPLASGWTTFRNFVRGKGFPSLLEERQD